MGGLRLKIHKRRGYKQVKEAPNARKVTTLKQVSNSPGMPDYLKKNDCLKCMRIFCSRPVLSLEWSVNRKDWREHIQRQAVDLSGKGLHSRLFSRNGQDEDLTQSEKPYQCL